MSIRKIVAVAAVLVTAAAPALAQSVNIDLGGEASTTSRIIQLVALLTVLSIAPSILVMVTSFTRIVVVLSRSEEHTSELQSLMRISYAVFCLKKKKQQQTAHQYT